SHAPDLSVEERSSRVRGILPERSPAEYSLRPVGLDRAVRAGDLARTDQVEQSRPQRVFGPARVRGTSKRTGSRTDLCPELLQSPASRNRSRPLTTDGRNRSSTSTQQFPLSAARSLEDSRRRLATTGRAAHHEETALQPE